jgi:hypothetical protein
MSNGWPQRAPIERTAVTNPRSHCPRTLIAGRPPLFFAALAYEWRTTMELFAGLMLLGTFALLVAKFFEQIMD